MKKLLFVDSCIRGKQSRTKKICDAYIKALSKKVSLSIEVIDLNSFEVLALNKKRLSQRDNALNNMNFDSSLSALSRQFAQADYIVFGAPYYDLSFPSILKVYIENIMQIGITFNYVNGKAQGLCKADKLIYITTAGGYIDSQNLGYYYVKAICSMIGIDCVECITAEGLDVIGNDSNEIINDVIDRIQTNSIGE